MPPSFFHDSYVALASAESHIPGRAVLHAPSEACRPAADW